jgi:hypothetical protein
MEVRPDVEDASTPSRAAIYVDFDAIDDTHIEVVQEWIDRLLIIAQERSLKEIYSLLAP